MFVKLILSLSDRGYTACFAPFFLFLLLTLGGIRLCRTTGSIPANIRVLLEILQLPGIRVYFQVGAERLPVVFQPFDQEGFPVLEVRLFLRREHMAVNLRRDTWRLLLVEPVRRARVHRPAGIHVQLDKRGEFLSLTVDHVFQIDGLPLAQDLLVLGCQLHVADFLWNIDFSGLRIMAGVIRPSCHLVYRDKRGESPVPVLEFHVLDQDGMSLAEHLYLGRREWYAPRWTSR